MLFGVCDSTALQTGRSRVQLQMVT